MVQLKCIINTPHVQFPNIRLNRAQHARIINSRLNGQHTFEYLKVLWKTFHGANKMYYSYTSRPISKDKAK